ncbi:MAG: secretin N-terminal domain-containing protein [Phycisphaerales bacterium JB038]
MRNSQRLFLPALALGAMLCAGGASFAQEAEDGPRAAEASGADVALTINGRRPLKGDPVTLGFDNVSVEKTIPFIVESTGKVVIPQKAVLGKTVTIVNDQPIPRNEALDLLFMALQQADVGVVETADVISLRLIEELDRQDVPVIGPDERVADRRDLGNMYRKVFALTNSSAENVGEVLQEALPSYAEMLVDADSNQVVVLGNVAMLQRLEVLVDALDRPSAAALETETFRLRYADAELIAENIEELYSADEATSGSGDDRRAQFMRMMQGRFDPRSGRGGPEEQQASTATSENLRVTANVQQNSVTVIAEPRVIEQIREQIDAEWDMPIPEEAVIPKTYDLEHSDPLKIADLLSSLFEEVEATRNSAGSEPVGRLTGQFTFQAIEESNRLVVVAKNSENLKIIDELIEDLDRPQTAGLPELVELKHADAEDLAEQLNALLSEDGTLAEIGRAEAGLSLDDSSESPFASDSSGSDSSSEQQTESISFWWQRSRASDEERSASNMVGKIRIVPISRQNALMILGPPEYHASLLKFIELLDRPGRQVLIRAVIAEITLEDATALGLRWSNSSNIFDGTTFDNRIGVTGGIDVTENEIFGDLFDTSVLNANIDLNILLDALDQRSGIQILSEPRIFTGDNQEAVFFDGQDIPFVTDSQTTDAGNVVNSFDYRSVGIQLRVRPRITKERNVDLRVNIELSSIREGETLFGGFIVDRRETTTQLIVGDSQTVVISGILRQQEDVINRKVPLLGDLPLIGALFRSTTRSTTNTELVAFITPVVVESDSGEDGFNFQELEELNEEPRKRLEELREQMLENAPTGPVDQHIIWSTPIEDDEDEDQAESDEPDADNTEEE